VRGEIERRAAGSTSWSNVPASQAGAACDLDALDESLIAVFRSSGAAVRGDHASAELKESATGWWMSISSDRVVHRVGSNIAIARQGRYIERMTKAGWPAWRRRWGAAV